MFWLWKRGLNLSICADKNSLRTTVVLKGLKKRWLMLIDYSLSIKTSYTLFRSFVERKMTGNGKFTAESRKGFKSETCREISNAAGQFRQLNWNKKFRVVPIQKFENILVILWIPSYNWSRTLSKTLLLHLHLSSNRTSTLKIQSFLLSV